MSSEMFAICTTDMMDGGALHDAVMVHACGAVFGAAMFDMRQVEHGAALPRQGAPAGASAAAGRL